MADEKTPQVQLAVSNKAAVSSKARVSKKATASNTAISDKTEATPPERKSGPNRPSVVSLNYPDKKSLAKAYMAFLKGGGLFLPTSTQRDMNEEIFLLVTLPESDKPIPVPGTVVWKTPSGAVDSKQQGVGIEFKGREGNSLRARIEGLLGTKLSSTTQTYTM